MNKRKKEGGGHDRSQSGSLGLLTSSWPSSWTSSTATIPSMQNKERVQPRGESDTLIPWLTVSQQTCLVTGKRPKSNLGPASHWSPLWNKQLLYLYLFDENPPPRDEFARKWGWGGDGYWRTIGANWKGGFVSLPCGDLACHKRYTYREPRGPMGVCGLQLLQQTEKQTLDSERASSASTVDC